MSLILRSALLSAALWQFFSYCGDADAEPTPAPDELPRIAPETPSAAIATFQIRSGFRIEQVAAEPLVADPVAIAFDEKGRLFVAEMRGYSERRDDRLGRISMLTDSNGDGIFDASVVFADGLRWPTGLICWKGGVFVIASPDILYFADADGDGRADSKEVVFTGFGSGRDRLNVQALPNSLTWGPDNRIHGATAMNGGEIHRPGSEDKTSLNGRDFSFDPDTLELRAENGGGQYGMTFDADGRKFVCSNSNHIQWIPFPAKFNAPGIPRGPVDIAVDGPSAEVFRTSPDEPWRIIRTRWRMAGQVSGPVEGGGRPSGYFTAATGITLFRGNAFSSDFQNNAFVCDAGSNLVHRKIVEPSSGEQLLQARRAAGEFDREFLTSSDNWFRPVQATNGPDGALYIVDMYREVIEHPWSLPESIKSQLDLNSGNDRGRIYRVVPDGFRQPAPLAFETATVADLVALLEHPNGWHRDTASRLLVEQKPGDITPALRDLALHGNTAPGRRAAVQMLAKFGQLNGNVISSALEDPAPAVRRSVIEAVPDLTAPGLAQEISRLTKDPSPEVAFAAALALVKLPASPETRNALVASLETHPNQKWCHLAALAGLSNNAADALDQVLQSERLRLYPATFEIVEGLLSKIPKPVPDTISASLSNVLSGMSDPTARAALVNVAGIKLPANELNALVTSIREIAMNRSAAIDSRISAVTHLSRLDPLHSLPALGTLLSTAEAPSLQQAAIVAIGGSNFSEGGSILAQRWPQLSPGLHRLAIAQFFRNSAWRSDLLDAIESKTIPPTLLLPQQIDALRSSGAEAEQARARRILIATTQPESSAILEHYAPSLKLKGDPAAGETIFTARCSSCHLKGKIGNRFGPDVGTFQNAGAASILANIVDPNREIQPRYATITVTTRKGALHLGYMVNETPESITLREIAIGDVTLERNSIAQMETLNTSPMPQGLEAGLSHQQMADLLAFISQP
ncbi:MAG: HEAT repeat domain-containing protein [Verrucomicrobiales bacterium]